MDSGAKGQSKLKMGEGDAARLCADLAPGQSVVGGRYSVRTKRLVDFRNKPGQYLSLVLGDRTGDIQARVWDNVETLAAGFEEGDVIAITGRVEAYQDKVQVIITDIVKCPPEEVRREDFLPKSERDPDEMMGELSGICKSVRDPGLRKLLAAFFTNEEFVAQFKACPAATHYHHAYIGGLLEHTLNVARMCDNVCHIYPQLDRDLLVSGALLHDIGKVREYSYDTTIGTTKEGEFIGHIVIGYSMALEAMTGIPELGTALRLHIGHLIIGHHGELEFGAPKRPVTAETYALHHVENLDAKVNEFLGKLEPERGKGKTWTEYDYHLKRRLFIGEGDEEAMADEAGEGRENE